MAGWILRIVLVIVIARLLWRFARGVLEGAGYLGHPGESSVGLVRDPVCGVFVVPSKALTAGRGAETRYFCSDKCRNEWQRGR
jgi:YHS domain-containing protein